MTVYYIPPYDGISNVTAFTPVRSPHSLSFALANTATRVSACSPATPSSATPPANHSASATAASTKTPHPSAAHPALTAIPPICLHVCAKAASVRKSRSPHAGTALISTPPIIKVTSHMLRSLMNRMRRPWARRIEASVRKVIQFICRR
jgi:hypothetical protein